MSRRRRNRRQLELGLLVTIAPPATSESDAVYLAVHSLRWDGCSVYRAGARLHVVNGRQVSTHGLIGLATSVKRPIEHRYAMARRGFKLSDAGYLEGPK